MPFSGKGVYTDVAEVESPICHRKSESYMSPHSPRSKSASNNDAANSKFSTCAVKKLKSYSAVSWFAINRLASTYSSTAGIRSMPTGSTINGSRGVVHAAKEVSDSPSA